ncbi:hypothetical protein GJAV_G00227950 [Gymnothorax javanicus]|nr:hypothetical protein GJAV_G00227950 [Gymnothorax javanicus]
MKSFHLCNSDMSQHQDNDLAGRTESTTESSSGGSGRSTHSGRGSRTLPHGAGELVAAAIAGPREKLAESERKAQTFVENQQFDCAVQERARCLALARLVYGDGHVRLAEAHSRLAEGYLLKGWAVQAREHSGQARDILHRCCPDPTEQAGEQTETLRCLLSVYRMQGQAAMILGDLEEAEASLKTAERIMGDLQPLLGAAGEKEETVKTEFEIVSTLSRLYLRQRRPEEALFQCMRALRLAEGCLGTSETCAVYRDMAAIEQAEGRLDGAIQHLQQAHSLAQSGDPGGVEEARLAHSLALAHSTSRDPGHKDSALRFFEDSLKIYSSIMGAQDPLSLTVQDDLCHFLLLIGQQENAVRLQRDSLALKRSTFGHLSQEVADTLQLIGGVEMTQGDMRRAYRTMSKCLEIQKLLFGPQHRKTRKTQRTVDMLSAAPEIAGRQRRAESLNTRPPFCAVIPSHNASGGTNVVSSDS